MISRGISSRKTASSAKRTLYRLLMILHVATFPPATGACRTETKTPLDRLNNMRQGSRHMSCHGQDAAKTDRIADHLVLDRVLESSRQRALTMRAIQEKQENGVAA